MKLKIGTTRHDQSMNKIIGFLEIIGSKFNCC